MLIFGNDIKNAIIDASSDAELLNNLQKFNEEVESLFIYFTFSAGISVDYIKNLLRVNKNKYAFWDPSSAVISLEESQETVFHIYNCTAGLIYATYKNTCYVMMICTHPDHQKKGYATSMLKALIEHMRGKVQNILLSSVDYAVSYYQHVGFEAIDCDLDNYPYLRQFEIVSPNKITTIMEYKL
jgi:ribosomal protein S18 acetylase RimI-like enzyme